MRARALATERLAPLLEALGRQEEAPQPEGVRFAVQFTGNVQGLATGAPVTIRGLRVGTVREIAVTFDSAAGELDVPVVIDVVPGSLVVDGARPETEQAVREAMATLVERGLRAQLASTSLLSAGREIALDLVPDAAPAVLGDGPLPVIPSVPTRLDTLSATLDKLLAKVGELPVERMAAELETMLLALRELVTAPELRQAVLDLAAAAGELRTTAGELAERADPLIASLTRTAEAAGPAAIETLTAARAVIAGPELREALANLTAMSAELRDLPARLEARSGPLRPVLSPPPTRPGKPQPTRAGPSPPWTRPSASRSTFQSDLQTLLREVTGATRSLRQVLDLLQRQPDVLIRGKQVDRRHEDRAGAAADRHPRAHRLRRLGADTLLSAQPGAGGFGGTFGGPRRVRRPGDDRALSGPGAVRLADRPRSGRLLRRADLGGAGDQHDHALPRRRAGHPFRAGPGAGDAGPARSVPDFRLAIDVQRFDGDQAGLMVLDARWTLLAGPDERFVATGRERIVEPADDPASWDARVAALGRALSVLGERLGQTIGGRAATS